MTTLRYFLEAALLHILFFVFKLFSPKTASNIGGWIGRTIGSKLATSRKALRNIQNVLPEADHDAAIAGMWDNLGRMIAEYPHIEEIAKNHTDIVGIENLQPYIDGKRSAIFIGGHFSNFEIPALCAYLQHGLAIDSTYRAPNNPHVHTLLSSIRSVDGKLQAYPKSKTGGRALMKAAKEKRNIGILIDQKYNEGVSIPFLGREAMTNPVFVQLAQKYGHDIVPIRTVREDGCRFTFHICEPITLGADESVESVITRSHILLEEWVREYPGQWLWLHRRWKD